MDEIVKILNYLATNMPWEALVASGIISPLLVGIKKVLSVQSERVMISLVLIVSILAATGHYLLTVPTSNPSIIAMQGAVLAFMTQPVYFFLVKPASKWFSETLAAAAAFKADVKSAAEPQQGLTTQAPQPPILSSTTTQISTPPLQVTNRKPVDINDFNN